MTANSKKSSAYFCKRGDLLSAAIVLIHLAIVFLPLYWVAATGGGWRLVACSVWFGIGMNGILNLFHECAHGHTFRRTGASAWLGRWVLGPLVLADFDSYQKRHWDHHRWLGEEADPKYIYRVGIRGFDFVWFMVRCLFLVEAAIKFSKLERAASPSPLRLMRILWVQAFLFLSLVLAASVARGNDNASALKYAALSYSVVYVYGIAAIAVFVSSLRGIAEHQIGTDGAPTLHGAALRNFSFGYFSGFLLGAYGFKNHASHHLEPGIPYYRLEAKTRELAAQNSSCAPKSSYEQVLFSLVRGR